MTKPRFNNIPGSTEPFPRPPWAMRAIEDSDLLPGGAKLAISAPAGTYVSRLDRSGPFHLAVSGETEAYLTAFDVLDITLEDDVVLVLPRSTLPINARLLPGYSRLAAPVRAEINAKYNLVGAKW